MTDKYIPQPEENEENKKLPYQRAAEVLINYLDDMSQEQRIRARENREFELACDLLSRFQPGQIISIFGRNLVNLVGKC